MVVETVDGLSCAIWSDGNGGSDGGDHGREDLEAQVMVKGELVRPWGRDQERFVEGEGGVAEIDVSMADTEQQSCDNEDGNEGSLKGKRARHPA